MQSSTVRGVINLGANGIELPFHLSEGEVYLILREVLCRRFGLSVVTSFFLSSLLSLLTHPLVFLSCSVRSDGGLLSQHSISY